MSIYLDSWDGLGTGIPSHIIEQLAPERANQRSICQVQVWTGGLIECTSVWV